VYYENACEDMLIYRKLATRIHTQPGAAAAVPCCLISEVSAVLKQAAVESDETSNGCSLDVELGLPTAVSLHLQKYKGPLSESL
jgi:hypothetical protein